MQINNINEIIIICILKLLQKVEIVNSTKIHNARKRGHFIPKYLPCCGN